MDWAQARDYGNAWHALRDTHLWLNPTCVVCGAPGYDVDHVLPLREGGPALDPANLQTLCRRHHGEKTWRESGRRAMAR